MLGLSSCRSINNFAGRWSPLPVTLSVPSGTSPCSTRIFDGPAVCEIGQSVLDLTQPPFEITIAFHFGKLDDVLPKPTLVRTSCERLVPFSRFNNSRFNLFFVFWSTPNLLIVFPTGMAPSPRFLSAWSHCPPFTRWTFFLFFSICVPVRSSLIFLIFDVGGSSPPLISYVCS